MKQFWLGFTEKMANTFKKKPKNGGEDGVPEFKENGFSDNASNPDFNLEQNLDMVPESEVRIEPQAAYEEPVQNNVPFPQSNTLVHAVPPASPSARAGKPRGFQNAVPEEEEYLPPKKKFSFKKFIFWLLFLLIVGGAGGAFYYISTIDWNRHKGKIAAQFSEITGKKIVFDGTVDLTLLPSPYLTASDIKIYNQDGPIDEPLAEIKSLVANLSLMPLLHGDFDVKMMSLVEPNVYFRVEDNDYLNWYGELSAEQKANLENMRITLDSVTLERAKFYLIDEKRDINLQLENLNAEIMAESIFGPFRVEGSYLKDNNPEGFAFSLGKLSSAFATTINLVVNQPTTETFVRFDGSVMLQNRAVNGNLIFESKKFRNFVNSNFKDWQLPEAYDYPLAVSLEVESNKTKVDIAKFVMKYGITAGAGNLLIPLNEDGSRPKAEFGFNFTEVDLDPVAAFIRSFVNKYKNFETVYNPQYNFDLLADLKTVKGRYRDQVIKDMSLSFDLIDNKINIRELKGVLPGDSAAEVTGDIYSDLEHLTYNFNVTLSSDEFQETLWWFDVLPETNSDVVLKRINLNTTIAGNPQKIAIKPIELTLDKSKFSGEIGIINGERQNYYVNIASDMVNLDNYFKPMPKEEAQKDFASRMNYRFSKLAVLNDFDMQAKIKLDLGIYENTPIENLTLNAVLKDGVLNFSSLNIGSLANATFSAQGSLKGFGESPVFENVKYELSTKDVASMMNKLEIKPFDFDWKKLKKFESKGITTGNVGRAAIKAVSKLEDISFVYGGLIGFSEGLFVYDGDLSVKAPDFVRMLNDFNVKYNPKTLSMGLFSLQTKFAGSSAQFTASSLQANVGGNSFEGAVGYDALQGRKNVSADLKINKLELDKFFYNVDYIEGGKPTAFRTPSAEAAAFLRRPVFDKGRLNYDFYKGFDFAGNFEINRLSYDNYVFDYAAFSLSSQNGAARLDNFRADFAGGKLEASADLNMLSPYNMNAVFTLTQAPINPAYWSGRKYGIKSGVFDLSGKFSASAESYDVIYNTLKAEADVSVSNPQVEGLNLKAIYENLMQRRSSEGLTQFVKDNLQKGTETFLDMKAKIAADNGHYTVEQGMFRGNDVQVAFHDEGSLSNWEMNAVFDVKYAQPDYLPGFSFTLGGSMENPVLEADTDALAIMYNSRQAEVDAQNRAKEEAETARLQGLMNSQMSQAKMLESELQNVLRPDVNAKKEASHNEEIRKRVFAAEKKLDALDKEVSEILLQGQAVDLTETMINTVSGRREKLSENIKNLNKELAGIELDNVKSVINENYNKIVNESNDAKKLLQDYQAQYAAWDKRLGKIETFYSLQNDDKVKKLRKKIDTNALALDQINNSVSAEFVSVQGSTNKEAVDRYASDLLTQIEDAGRYGKNIADTIEELALYADVKVSAEEKAYAQRVEAELIKKKMEENTGKIMVKDTGESKTVTRDWEDIKKSEEAVDKEAVKVLDFSTREEGNVVRPAAVEPTAKSESREEDGNSFLIKKTEGEISRASGVIRKK